MNGNLPVSTDGKWIVQHEGFERHVTTPRMDLSNPGAGLDFAKLLQSLFHWLLAKMPGRRNWAAAATLLIILVAVIIPALAITGMVVDQSAGVYAKVQSGQIDFARYFQQVHDGLPEWVQRPLDRSGLGSFDNAQARIVEAVRASFRSIASQALSIGRNTAAFLLAFGVGLYVTYFLLRDGERLAPKVRDALPLERSVADRLLGRFVAVVRATIKGSVLVALAQGALGAITFWIVGVPAALLWGLLMALVALLPAVGPALVWVPVAIYLLATGAVWQGVVVVVSGVAVIGLADNILRPILVGRDAGIPDWLVLVTTLGGIEVAGLSGIVVGPLVAALFLTGWQILTEEREGRRISAAADAADAPRKD